MNVTHSFEAVRSYERFCVTARAAEFGSGRPYVQVLVKDTESRSSLRLIRAELMPLLGAVKEVLREVEHAVAGLPSDPVERAARRIPHIGMASSMQRAHILKAYRQELEELRERYVRRFDPAAGRAEVAISE